MNKTELKKHFLDVHQQLLDNIEQSTDSFEEAADIDEDDTLDKEDYSHQNEAKSLAERMQKHENEIAEDHRFLESLRTEPLDEVSSGSLVKLDGLWIYVSIAAKAFDFEGARIQPISVKAPIYSSIAGKRKGDSIVLGKEEKTILSIF